MSSDERTQAILQARERAAKANVGKGRIGGLYKLGNVSEPTRQQDGSFVFPQTYSQKQIDDFLADNYYQQWALDYQRGKSTAQTKFENNDSSLTEKSFLPAKYIPETQRTKMKLFDLTSKYAQDAYTYGYNEVVNKLLLDKGVKEWNAEMARGYNEMADKYGNDADLLYKEEPQGAPDKPNPNQFLLKRWNQVQEPDNNKYAFDGYIWGHNLALKTLYATIPRPQKKNWADYFVEGVTTPFNVVSQIAPHLVGI